MPQRVLAADIRLLLLLQPGTLHLLPLLLLLLLCDGDAAAIATCHVGSVPCISSREKGIQNTIEVNKRVCAVLTLHETFFQNNGEHSIV